MYVILYVIITYKIKSNLLILYVMITYKINRYSMYFLCKKCIETKGPKCSKVSTYGQWFPAFKKSNKNMCSRINSRDIQNN